MALKTFYLHPFTFASTQIDGVVGQDFNPGATFDRPLMDGNIDPYSVVKTMVNPNVSFQTHSVAAGLAIAGFDSATGALVFYDKQVAGGLATAGSTHNKITFAAARMFPRSLVCQQAGHAILTM